MSSFYVHLLGCTGFQFQKTAEEQEPQLPVAGFRVVPKTGVIYVMDEAAKAGYCALTAKEWANLGQGSPETTRAKQPEIY